VRELATQRVRVDVVDEGALAVDLDDRKPLPKTSLELRLARDVDLLELEFELIPQSADRLACAPA
jgi:hypothetical protein